MRPGSNDISVTECRGRNILHSLYGSTIGTDFKGPGWKEMHADLTTWSEYTAVFTLMVLSSEDVTIYCPSHEKSILRTVAV